MWQVPGGARDLGALATRVPGASGVPPGGVWWQPPFVDHGQRSKAGGYVYPPVKQLAGVTVRASIRRQPQHQLFLTGNDE